MNYRAWNHRCWLVSYMTISQVLLELQSSRDWAGLHVADNSCFHYRVRLLLQLIESLRQNKDPNGLSGEEFHQTWKDELDWVGTLIRRYVGREALWLHRRFLSLVWVKQHLAVDDDQSSSISGHSCCTSYDISVFMKDEFTLLHSCINFLDDGFGDYQAQATHAATYITWLAKQMPMSFGAELQKSSQYEDRLKLLLDDAGKSCLWESMIRHPRSHLDRFDMVITPQHDYYPLTPHAQEQVPRFLRKWITPHEPPNERVVLTVGALHQVDSASLRSAANAWHDEFAPLLKPLIVVNIGEPTRYCKYSTDIAKQLIASLHNVLTSCGSVRISFSRRTPDKISNVIVKELGTHPKVYIWDGEEPNPHMGHLAWGDAFIVTADSVSMLSEACSTGKPVYAVGSERCTWKFLEFHKMLRERGLVRPFTGLEDMSESWSYPPLNDTSEAASRVHKALAERGWRLRP